MGVSKLVRMVRNRPDFIDARVKINDAYYRDVLLTQKLPPVMREICGEFFIFQQGNVSAHGERRTVHLLKRDTCVHFSRPFTTQQHRSEPSWLQKYVRNAAAGLASSWRRWTETALDQCLASFHSKRHRWRSWWVAQMSLGVNLSKRKTFWAF